MMQVAAADASGGLGQAFRIIGIVARVIIVVWIFSLGWVAHWAWKGRQK